MSPTSRDVRCGTQAALLFGAIVLGLVVVLCTFIAHYVSAKVRNNIGNDLHSVATGAQRMLVDGLHERLMIVERLAATESLWKQGLDSPEVAAALAQQKLVHDDLAWMGVADADGVVRTATGGLLVGRDVRGRLASRSISRPLAAMARAAADVQSGKPGARIPRVDGNVELRELSNAR